MGEPASSERNHWNIGLARLGKAHWEISSFGCTCPTRKAAGVSVKQTNALWQRECDPKRMHLLHAICDCADDDGRAFPSINYLAWKTGLARSTVLLYMQGFRENGVLENLGRRAALERRVEANSERDTSVVMVHLDKLPLKKPWREIRGGSTATGLRESNSGPTGVQLEPGGSPAAGGATKEESSVEPSQNQTLPLIPPLRGGKLTVRQLRQLNDEIFRVMEDPQVELESAVETACARLLLPLELAWEAVRAAGLGEVKKQPQRAAS
jgi:hypothetical protein